MDVAAIMNRARWLLKDTKASWATDAFLLEGMNHVSETAFLELVNINFPFDESVIELLNVPANTVNLSAYDASQTNLLQFLVTPRYLDWKLNGRPVTEYSSVDKVDKLPDIGTGVSAANVVSSSQSVDYWEYRSMAIFITPASVAVDIRIRFQQLFGELVGSDGQLAIGSIRSFLGVRLAQYVAGTRENYDMVKYLAGEGDNLLSLIEANFIKSAQGQTRRLGSPANLRRIYQRRGGRYPNLRP